jgi:hypothetical protein
VGSAGSRKKDLKYIVVAIFWSVENEAREAGCVRLDASGNIPA